MKKVLFYCLFLTAVVISCSKDNTVDLNIVEVKFQVNDVTRDLVDIYANARFGKTKGNTIKVEPILRDNDTLAYILNYGKGWELVAGDERYTPIVAKGEGVYDLKNLNAGQSIWLESELERVKAVKNNLLIPSEEDRVRNKRFWDRIRGPKNITKAEGDPVEGWELVEVYERSITETSNHILQTKWGQFSPWNECVPVSRNTNSRSAAGCVAVAGAQILKYLHDKLGKPATFFTEGSCTGYINNPTYIFANPSADAWSNMALSADSNSSINSSERQVAILIGWIGREVDMAYGGGSSAAPSDSLKALLSRLSINSQYVAYNASSVYSQLMNEMPVYVEARFTSNANLSNAHAWVIDGYRTDTCEYEYIYRYTEHGSPYNEYGEEKSEFEYEINKYLLMNWGYGSVDEALYSTSDDATWTYVHIDESSNRTDYPYRYHKKVIYDFR